MRRLSASFESLDEASEAMHTVTTPLAVPGRSAVPFSPAAPASPALAVVPAKGIWDPARQQSRYPGSLFVFFPRPGGPRNKMSCTRLSLSLSATALFLLTRFLPTSRVRSNPSSRCTGASRSQRRVRLVSQRTPPPPPQNAWVKTQGPLRGPMEGGSRSHPGVKSLDHASCIHGVAWLWNSRRPSTGPQQQPHTYIGFSVF